LGAAEVKAEAGGRRRVEGGGWMGMCLFVGSECGMGMVGLWGMVG